MISFLFSPIGRMIGAGLLIVTLAGGIYAKGHVDGRSGEHARVERAIATEQQRQARESAAAVKAAEDRATAREAEVLTLRNEVAAYETELAKRPADAQCVGTPADLERLRQFIRRRAR